MSKLESKIRQFYQPVQPSVKLAAQGIGSVNYQEISAHTGLQDFIYCYWQLKTNHALTETFNYRVVADGCIDIFFELENPQESFIMGFCDQFTEFPLPGTFNYVGLRFLPGMFSQIFDVDAFALNNRFESLQAVAPGLSKFIKDSLHPGLSLPELKAVLDDFFVNQISDRSSPGDSRMHHAMAIILESSGMLNIEKDLDVGISSRQLRRLFRFYVGGTPKTFSKIVRFQKVLSTAPLLDRAIQEKLFFDAGYYDQAHFIHEFNELYGLTPQKAFRQ